MSLYEGIQGVNISWMATIPGMEDIEEMAESLPERAEPCPECNGTGLALDPARPSLWHLVPCDCRRELGGSG